MRFCAWVVVRLRRRADGEGKPTTWNSAAPRAGTRAHGGADVNNAYLPSPLPGTQTIVRTAWGRVCVLAWDGSSSCIAISTLSHAIIVVAGTTHHSLHLTTCCRVRFLTGRNFTPTTAPTPPHTHATSPPTCPTLTATYHTYPHLPPPPHDITLPPTPLHTPTMHHSMWDHDLFHAAFS